MKLGVLLTSGCLVATACGGSIFSTSDSIDGGGGGSNGHTGGSGGAGGTTGHTGGAAGMGGAAGSGAGGAAGSGMGGAAGSGMGGAAGAVDAGGDASPEWAACDGPGQCVAELTACCPPCSVPQLDQFAGVNSSRVDAFHTANCPVALPCAACASGPNPNIAARCHAGRCEAFDVRKVPEFSGCSGDQDCHLRSGLGCCECGGGSGWVALSTTGGSALTTAECAPMSACADCLPVPPTDISPVCEGGACQVKSSGGATCSLVPQSSGCCFSTSDCGGGGQHCYQAQCSAGSEGRCVTPGSSTACWGDSDCPSNEKCIGAMLCPCGASCLVADTPGTCQ